MQDQTILETFGQVNSTHENQANKKIAVLYILETFG